MKIDELPRDYSIFVRPVGKTNEWSATIYHLTIEWSRSWTGKSPSKAIAAALKDFVPLPVKRKVVLP